MTFRCFLRRLALPTLVSGLLTGLFSGCASRPCAIGQEYLNTASTLRNLPFLKPVECRWASRAEVKVHLRESLLKRMTADDLEREGKLYELLGVIPEGYPYVERMLDAYSDRLLAFYSPELKFFVMVAKQNTRELEPVLVHELTHVLQDQHFDAEAMLDEKLDNDRLLARTAIFEGDANRVMHRYQKVDVCSELTEDRILETMRERLKGRGQIPRALELVMSFPYPYGERYLCELEKREGKESVARVFSRLPESTLEVVTGDKSVSAPPMLDASAAEALHSDRLGAFTVVALLSNYLSLEKSYAFLKLWREDLARLSREKDGTYRVDWAIRLSNEADSAQFEVALREAYRVRFASGGWDRAQIERDGDTVTVGVRASALRGAGKR